MIKLSNHNKKNRLPWKLENNVLILLSNWITKMPTVKMIYNINIDIYSRDHPPPHFHAKFAEYEELIVIETLETYAGKIPKVQRRKVTNWVADNKQFLLEIFNKLNPRP